MPRFSTPNLHCRPLNVVVHILVLTSDFRRLLHVYRCSSLVIHSRLALSPIFRGLSKLFGGLELRIQTESLNLLETMKSASKWRINNSTQRIMDIVTRGMHERGFEQLKSGTTILWLQTVKDTISSKIETKNYFSLGNIFRYNDLYPSIHCSLKLSNTHQFESLMEIKPAETKHGVHASF